jgi:hypothetical protein
MPGSKTTQPQIPQPEIRRATCLTDDPQQMAAMWRVGWHGRRAPAHGSELSLGERSRSAAHGPHEVELVDAGLCLIAGERRFMEAGHAVR